MLFPVPALNKKQLKTTIVITASKTFVIFKFSQSRRKYLRNQRTFYAQLIIGQVSFTYTFEQLCYWFEGITEDYLLEKLEDTPQKHRPIITVAPRIKLDFNVTEEDVKALL